MESPLPLQNSMDISNNNTNVITATYLESKILNLKCFKWHNNHKRNKYDEMFDYETDRFMLSEYNVKNSCTIVDNFQRISYHDNIIDTYQSDFEINYNDIEGDKGREKNISNNHTNRQFTKENIIVEKNGNKFIVRYNTYAYIVCKYYSDTDPELELSIGRFIRVGKFILNVCVLKLNNLIKFKQRDYSNESCLFQDLDKKLEKNPQKSLDSPVNKNEEPSCRFCFKPESRHEDPLISVCNCKGTLRFLHSSCLEFWIKSKCKIDYEYVNPNCYKISLLNFYCEICKKTFPLVVKDTKSNRNIFLLNILNTKNNFIIFKSKLIDDEFSFSNFRDESKTKKEEKSEFYFIQLESNNIYMRKTSIIFGRDKKCDIVLNDVSVSRRHFMIYLDSQTESVRIKDLHSKFGTLLNMRDDLEINEKVTIQKGNTVHHFKAKNMQSLIEK